MKDEKTFMRNMEWLIKRLEQEDDKAIQLMNDMTGPEKMYWRGYSSGLETACKELYVTIRILRG